MYLESDQHDSRINEIKALFLFTLILAFLQVKKLLFV